MERARKLLEAKGFSRDVTGLGRAIRPFSLGVIVYYQGGDERAAIQAAIRSTSDPRVVRASR